MIYSFHVCGPLRYHTHKGLEELVLLSNLQPILVFRIVNSTQWNVINSPSVLWNLLHPLKTWFSVHFGNINNILKTIRRCQMLTGCYFVKRINSDRILSLWSLRSLLERQSVVDVNSTIHIRMCDQIATVDGRKCQFSYIILSRVSRLGIILLMHRTSR